MTRRGTGRTVACPGTYVVEISNGVDQVLQSTVTMVGDERILDASVERAVAATGGWK